MNGLGQVAFMLFCGVASIEESSCSAQEGCEEQQPVQVSLRADDATSLMQMVLAPDSRRGSKANKAASGGGDIAVQISDVGGTCSDLTNQGAFFTIKVDIGHPHQSFDLVADTGSDALIIPDCRCVEKGYCDTISTCFKPADSKSFDLEVELNSENKSLVMGAKMDYGSGEIQVLVGSDDVNVAGITTKMLNGVFLMEDRRSLAVHGDFEGILGLGLPHKNKLSKDAIVIPSFMDISDQVASYSVCFNDFPNAGAFRTSPEPLKNPMTNIGSVHWGLDLQGFSVGDASSHIVFCDPSTIPAGQKTACGAIPDSGTTLMMGPADQIHMLYGALCDKWPRCQKTLKDEKSRSEAFHKLLAECTSWMTDEHGVGEVPSIFMHVAGVEGVKQTVELSAWSYVVETTEDIYQSVSKELFDVVPMLTASDTGETKNVCTASFGPQDYTTPENGPVWIMGAPVFFANTVGYAVGGGKPGQISFQVGGMVSGGCTSCDDKKASLLSDQGVTAPAQRSLRRLSGKIRSPGAKGPL